MKGRIAASITILKYGIVLFLLTSGFQTKGQDTLALYNGAIPNSKPYVGKAPKRKIPGLVYFVSQPSVTIYLPKTNRPNTPAVIICPGGSYKVLTFEAEGIRTAQELAKQGIAAFVLKYRLPDDSAMTDKKSGPLQDVQQAIKIVRNNATKWHLDSTKIGLMGFSAGGHLAATAATLFKHPVLEDGVGINLRPDFLILVYPVISMQDALTHLDSRKNLLGDQASQNIKDYFSAELQVDKDTPPTYITHAGDDKLVDIDNSIEFYEHLRHQQVPAELHIYPKGGHGFVLAQPSSEWMAPLFAWMKHSHLINE